MKVEFEIEGFKCKAETDIVPDITADAAVSNEIFSRLCDEVRTIALKMIDSKYGNRKQGIDPFG